jgi:hypothetical protein
MEQPTTTEDGEREEDQTAIDLRMTHLPLEDDEEPHRQSSPPNSVIDQLFERLTTLSNQLESAVELLSSLQAQHGATQSTISVVESISHISRDPRSDFPRSSPTSITDRRINSPGILCTFLIPPSIISDVPTVGPYSSSVLVSSFVPFYFHTPYFTFLDHIDDYAPSMPVLSRT